MSVDWRDEGLTEGLQRLLAETQNLAPDAAAGAKVILDGSNDLVPKISTELESTGKVDESRGGLNTAVVLYTSVYAHWIHEHLGFKHPHGGQAKFLETALLSKGPDAVNKAGEHLWERL